MVNRNYNLLLLILLSFILVTIVTVGCSDNLNINTDASVRLRFSSDTISFDTVFSTIGSATSRLVIYNNENQSIKISKIFLNSSSSPFKVNVDGSVSSSNVFSDILIRPHDSIHIFVSVRIDPTGTDKPLLVEDSIRFLMNGKYQKVQLRAFGQDMVLLKNHIIHSDTVFSSPKPILIIGNLVVDKGKSLTILAGCRLYFHSNANLIVNGNFSVNGTYQNPVILRGDRLDKVNYNVSFPYNNLWGQWGGVYLKGSGNKYSISHLHVNGGVVGINIDNPDLNNLSNLSMDNSIIHNFTTNCLSIQNCNVTAYNCEISNSAQACVLLKGGTHSFSFCTVANYFNNSNLSGLLTTTRTSEPALLISELDKCAPMQTLIKNSIVTGSATEEMSIVSLFPDNFNGVFVNNYIQKLTPSKQKQYKNILWGVSKDTIFKNTYYDYTKNKYYDFTLDSISKARGVADAPVDAQYALDLKGNSRTADGKPDLGAYEWVSKK